MKLGFPGNLVVKNPPANAGDVGSFPGSRRSPGEGNDNLLQYSRLELGFPWSSTGKESACSAGDLGLIPGLGRPPWRRKWKPTPVSLPGKSHGQRSLVGCSPWGRRELGTSEQLTLTYLFLPGKSHGQRVLEDYSPCGCKESDMTEQLSMQPDI